VPTYCYWTCKSALGGESETPKQPNEEYAVTSRNEAFEAKLETQLDQCKKQIEELEAKAETREAEAEASHSLSPAQ